MTQQTVLITGASSGMGKDFAKALLAANYRVYTAARRVELMDDLKALGATPIKMDVTEQVDIDAAVAQIQQEAGGVDILINNAGFGLYGAMEDITIDEARYQFEVNLFGLAALTQAVLPEMRKKWQGRVINISSMGGQMYTPLGSWYHATKHALEGWSDCLRLELATQNIDVVLIQPGAIATEFGDVMIEPMLKRSGIGPYGAMAQALAKTSRASYEQGKSSPASVITRLVMKAVTAKHPKTRYAGGLYAKPMLFIRKTFGDRFFDKLVMLMVRG